MVTDPTAPKLGFVTKLLYGTGMTMVYGKGESKKTLFCLTVAVHVAASGRIRSARAWGGGIR